MKLEHFYLSGCKVPCLMCGKMISEGTLDRDRARVDKCGYEEANAFKAYMCEFPCVNEYLNKYIQSEEAQ